MIHDNMYVYMLMDKCIFGYVHACVFMYEQSICR